MSATRAGYRDWLYRRLGVIPSRDRWIMDRDIEAAQNIPPSPDTPPIPAEGVQPTDALQLTNTLLNDAMATACHTIIRECRVQNAFNFTDLPVSAAASTFLGPSVFNLSTIPGYTERSAVSIKRAYWYDGQSYWQLQPTMLSQLDTQQVNYFNVSPSTPPTQFAIEGDLVYLLPANANDGVLRLTIGSGVLPPLTDLEGYGSIPEAYDDAVNYIALTEIAAMLTNNVEMTNRAQAFLPMAAKSIMELTNWFDNLSNDQFISSSTFRTPIIRYSRRG